MSEIHDRLLLVSRRRALRAPLPQSYARCLPGDVWPNLCRWIRWSYVGGAERDRTVDLLNAIQALSQLSYGPTRRESLAAGQGGCQTRERAARAAATARGAAPSTSSIATAGLPAWPPSLPVSAAAAAASPGRRLAIAAL